MRRASMFLPRRSRAESIVSMHSSREVSLTEVKKPKNIWFENTYKLDPEEKPKMNEIQELMQRILHASCDDLSYKADCEDSNFCTVLNDELHKRVKQLIPNRYRFTIQVIIGAPKICSIRWSYRGGSEYFVSIFLVSQ